MRVLDLIIQASRTKCLGDLPDEIRIKGISNKIWVRFGSGYYDGKHSLGDLVAFNRDWLNTEIEVVCRQGGVV